MNIRQRNQNKTKMMKEESIHRAQDRDIDIFGIVPKISSRHLGISKILSAKKSILWRIDS